MTPLRTRLEFTGIILGICLFIFFMPFVMGRTQPNIEAAVQQNMAFLDEMVNKYMEKHQGRPPQNLTELYNNARSEKYNKTVFNPLLKNGGDISNESIMVQYPADVFPRINKDYTNPEYTGKTGYYTDGNSYAIYGHIQGGALLKQDGKVIVYGNFEVTPKQNTP